MLKRISTMKACYLTEKMINGAGMENNEYLIEKNGKPVAALVPAWMLIKKQKRTQEFLELMSRGNFNSEREILDEEVSDVIHEAIVEVRKQNSDGKIPIISPANFLHNHFLG